MGALNNKMPIVHATDCPCYDRLAEELAAQAKAIKIAREALQAYADFEKDITPTWFIAREALACLDKLKGV